MWPQNAEKEKKKKIEHGEHTKLNMKFRFGFLDENIHANESSSLFRKERQRLKGKKEVATSAMMQLGGSAKR